MWLAAGSGIASMHALVSLASALNNADADGRVVIDVAGGTLKFLLLNAAAHFAKVRCNSHFTIDLVMLAFMQQCTFPNTASAARVSAESTTCCCLKFQHYFCR